MTFLTKFTYLAVYQKLTSSRSKHNWNSFPIFIFFDYLAYVYYVHIYTDHYNNTYKYTMKQFLL